MVTISEPDEGEKLWTFEFCNWECLGHWAADQAGGSFVCSSPISRSVSA
jgi:hypothetical protein